VELLNQIEKRRISMKIRRSSMLAVLSSFILLSMLMVTNGTVCVQAKELSGEKIAVLQQKALTRLTDSILKIQEMPVAEEDIRRVAQYLPANITGIIEEIIAVSKSSAPVEEKVDAIIRTYDSSCYDYVIASIVADALYYFLCVHNPAGCGPFGFLDEISYVTWALAVLCYYGVL
jgi:aspartate carbamoyltransferase regulatory subunit